MNHTGTRTIKTQRLLLRRFGQADAEEYFSHSTADDPAERYIPLRKMNGLGDAKMILAAFIESYNEPSYYHYAIEESATGRLCGAIFANVKSERHETAELGYNIYKPYRNNGYATEALCALIDYMLYDVKVNRLEAFYAAQNTASGRVLVKAGMNFEGISRQKYKLESGCFDSMNYGLTKCDYEKTYLPKSTEFLHIPDKLLDDGVIGLRLKQLAPYDMIKKYVPAYIFSITDGTHPDGTHPLWSGGESMGEIALRLGFNDALYYSGHVGYTVYEPYRTRGIATRAVELIKKLAALHGFPHIIITSSTENPASRRVCEKAGLTLVREAKIPSWHEMYKEGERTLNIFRCRLP